ncbi:MAG: hypothetical protein ACKVTZ_05920 [Bacteroidia bacterium]
MKLRFLLLLFYFSFFLAFSQKKSFPQAWEGIWKGELSIYNAKGTQMQLPMELHILPLDSAKWTWKIVYAPKDKPKDERPYELIIKDKAKGHYAIDEKDGIVLDAFYMGEHFFSTFAVQGTEITAIEHLEGKNLILEMIASNSKELNITGGTSEEVPPVSSFATTSYHKAVLKRVKK